MELAADSSQRVRFQVLLSSGFLSSHEARSVRDRLLLEGIADPWIPIAALSASSDEALRLLELAASRLTGEESEGAKILFRTVASVLGARQKNTEISALFTRILSAPGPDWWKSEVLGGLLRGTRTSASDVLSRQDLQEHILRIFLEGSLSLRPAALELIELAGFPDGPLTDQTLEGAAILLRDLLLPSESIAPEYLSYVVERISGGIEEGVLRGQTPQALILLVEEAQEIVIPRDDIRRFYAADVSAMPGNLETLVSVEEMAHLLRFLKTR